uniref:Glycerophosphodiester phosphodiesterase domain containing 3 n=1 Tax=Chelonoidis abingdonii TaxID=106734 RepID=A0A8C0IQ13_CHEAB
MGQGLARGSHSLSHPQVRHTPAVPAWGGGGCVLGCLPADPSPRSAVAQGTQLLELDCQRTRDGVVVVSHDQNLQRQAGQDQNIRELDYADLPPYRDPLEVTFSPGAFSHGSDRRIPRLEEIFQKFPNVPVNVEIKQDDEELIRQVADLVRRYRRSHITVWASFQSKILEKCRAANPDMPYIFSVQRGLLLLLLYYTGLLPFVRLPESFLQFPLPSIINRCRRTPGSHGQEGAWSQDSWVLPSSGRGGEAWELGVLLWVLNEEKDFEEAFSYGVSGVMSDYPTLLRHYLDTHPPPGQDTTEE